MHKSPAEAGLLLLLSDYVMCYTGREVFIVLKRTVYMAGIGDHKRYRGIGAMLSSVWRRSAPSGLRSRSSLTGIDCAIDCSLAEMTLDRS